MCELIKIVMLLFLFKFFNNEKSLYLVVGFKLAVGLFKINNLGLCNNVWISSIFFFWFDEKL